MNQYSLTNMTNLLERHYEYSKNNNITNKDIMYYINHKIRHTYAVLFVAQKIITYEKKIFNNAEIIKKAEIAALLHDIWRFYQNNGEKVLSWNEFEHGDVWYNILINEWINDLAILFAVKYHNKINIDWLYNEEQFIKSQNKEEILTIVKLVRDADKIQNLEYMLFDIDNKLYHDNTDNNDILTTKVLNCFMNKKLVDRNYINSNLDNLLYYISWISDLNFKTSLDFLKRDNFWMFMIDIINHKQIDDITKNKIKKIILTYL